MTQKKIDTGNEKLAKFLDWYEQDGMESWFKKTEYSIIVAFTPIHPYRDLPFHRDWNYLMEVLDKIIKVGYGFQFTPSKMMIFDCNKAHHMSRFEASVIPVHYCADTKIEMIWNACVNFVNWYNKGNKNGKI